MARASTGSRLTTPTMLAVTTPDELSALQKANLARCYALLGRILAVAEPRTLVNTLVPFNDLSMELQAARSQPLFLTEVHPDPAVRSAADAAYQEAEKYATALSLNRALYDALAAIDVSGEDGETRFSHFKILRDFRRAGVDRDEATRARIQTLQDEIAAISLEFDRNIREDERSIQVDGPEDLEGLPEDFIRAHPQGSDGKITLTTSYPDALPVGRYAKKADVRKRLMREFLERGHPKNLEVLTRLLAKRYELAKTLAYPHYADYVTEDKMIGSARAAGDFIERVTQASEERARQDHALLLERKRKDDPSARTLERWDVNYYTEVVRAESHGFDVRRLRPYFEFSRVRDGLFALTSRLFGIRYRRVPGVRVWHESVEVYDVYDGRKRLGRFYLDLFPRKDKFSHAAASLLVLGIRGVQLPQAALMCNFPDPRAASPALMDFQDVDTFFHEFGHLLHGLLSGGVRWVHASPHHLEFDFIEAPSQILEEWVRDPEVLRSFAIHHETREPVPEDLVRAIKRAEGVARGLDVQRQLVYATISLTYYDRDPAGMDTTRVLEDVHARFPLVAYFDGTHFQCGFGHLTGYSATYYTYMWSLVIAKDLFSRFRARGSLLDPTEARRYRKEILEPGSARPAVDLVRSFLERETGFGPFEEWLTKEGL